VGVGGSKLSVQMKSSQAATAPFFNALTRSHHPHSSPLPARGRENECRSALPSTVEVMDPRLRGDDRRALTPATA
jgi:hypothetical protein